jgi:hypothetical protein
MMNSVVNTSGAKTLLNPDIMMEAVFGKNEVSR